jgi:hypothetical protein
VEELVAPAAAVEAAEVFPVDSEVVIDAAAPVDVPPEAKSEEVGTPCADHHASLSQPASPMLTPPEVATVAPEAPASQQAEQGDNPRVNQAVSATSPTQQSEVADGQSTPPPETVKKKPLNAAHLILILRDVYAVVRGESKDKLRRPAYWIDAEPGLDLSPETIALLEGDDSEDARDILRKRKLMIQNQIISKEKEEERRRADEKNEMPH